MKSTTCLLVTSLALGAEAINLNKRSDDLPPRVVGFSIQRRHVEDHVSHDRKRWRKRADTLGVTIDNQQSLYYANASVGTPAQDFRLQIDTGSSDLWVNSGDSTFCSRRSEPCAESGTYDANSSSTYEYVNSNFNISYADGSGATGDYITDVLRLGGTTVKDLQMGVGYDSTTPQGIIGIGYKSNEAGVIRNGDDTYDNLPAKMASDGTIQSNAYSVWLNDLDANTGSLLFGGVDRAQYTGSLVTVPIVQSNGEHREFLIALQGVSLAGETLGDDLSLAVLLDSGTSLTYLPVDMVADIYDMVSADFDERQGAAVVPCSLANQDANMTFTFADDLSITVPLNELVLSTLTPTQTGSEDEDAVQACLFGVAPVAEGGTNVLGDTFLRSAYVVFDLGNNEVSLAQSRFNATDTDVVEIGSGSDPVPSAITASGGGSVTSGLPEPTETEENIAGNMAPSWMAIFGALGVGVGVAAAV